MLQAFTKRFCLLTVVMLLSVVNALAQDVIEIGTVEELKTFRDAVNKGDNSYSGKTIKLTADLDLSSESNWTPIGNVIWYPTDSFHGTFDGDGHSISNVTVDDNTPEHACAGLFGSLYDGTIKNLTVKNINLRSTHYAGGIVAYMSDKYPTTVENCHVIGGTITSTPEIVNGSYDDGDKVGGITGYTNANATINNCTVEDVTITAYRDMGGIVGYSDGTVTNNTVINVTVTQDLTNGYKNPHPTTYGDIIGRGSATLSDNQVVKKTYVAQIDEVKYETLQAAVDAATAGQTITLLKDFTLTTEKSNVHNVVVNKSLTIDGDGHTITSSSTRRPLAVSGKDNQITLKNMTVVNMYQVACLNFLDKLTCTLDNVTLDNSNAKGAYNQPITINSTIEGNDKVTLNITNGSVIKTNNDATAHYAIIAWHPADINVTNSTIKGWAAVYVKPGAAGTNVSISNSTLVSSNIYNGESNSFAAFTMEDNNVKVNVTNSNITISNTGENQYQAIALASRSLTDIAVNLGEGNTVTFDGTGEVAYVLNSPIVKVSGGEFNAPVPEYCCAEGYIPTTLDNGKYGVKEGSFVAQIDDVKYETLAEAIADVPTDGTETTITMLANETVTEELTIATGKNIVLELNGKTISEACSKSGTSALITNNGTLTIQDITDVNKDGSGTGKITYTNGNPDTQSIPGYASNTIINHGSLTLNSGYIENTTNGGYAAYTVDNVTNGNLHTPTFIMSGGKLFNSYTDAVRMFLNSTTNLNKVTISGGILNSDKASGRVVVMHMPSANLGKGELNITGGSINGKVNAWSAANAGGVEDRFSDEQYANVKINITGGNIKSLNFAEMANTELRANSLVVTGGTYEVNPTEYVAEGYEAVDNKNSTWTVGKIVVSEEAFEEAAETAVENNDGSVTYTITPTVADSDGETIGDSTTEEKEITVAISSEETNVAEGASLDNLKMANVLTKAIQTEGAAAADKINVSIAVVAKDKTETAEAPAGTVVFDVHPEATVTVNNQPNSPVELANSDLADGASFTFTLNVDEKFEDGATVKVVHKSDEFGDETFYKTVSGKKVSITVTHFSIFELSEVSDVVPANISEVGYATFSSTKALDFTDITTIHAYTAEVKGNKIEFTRIKKVPAETGLLLRNPNGGAVSAYVPVIDYAAPVENNDLKAVVDADIAKLPDFDDFYYYYILNNVNGYGVGFYRANDQSVAKGRAYLRVSASSSPVQSFTNLFDGETTAIDSITTSDEQTQDNVFYDLSGRRVSNPQRGLYIVNGKKVLVK